MNTFLWFIALPLGCVLGLWTYVTVFSLSAPPDEQTIIRNGFAVLFAAVAGVLAYFLPAIIGHKKHNARAIFVLNLLLGWTLLGWVGALVWACTKDPQPVTA